MSVITTGTNPKTLWPGLNAIWGRDYRENEQEWRELFDVETSRQAYEEDLEITGFGLAPKKPEGSPMSYDAEAQGVVKRYTHVAYALGYIVTHEEQADNLYAKVAERRTQALGFGMRQTKEIVAANQYNRAFNSSYVGADGVEMLSTAHPTLAGNQSNELAVAADLSEASLEALCIQIGKAKNARGLQISIRPKALIIPTDLTFTAHRILNSVLQSDTANNAVNAIRAMGKIPKVAENHYLTDTDAFFIRTDAPRGAVMFQREAASFGQDNDFDTKNLKYGAYERYSFGWTDWRGIYGSAGA